MQNLLKRRLAPLFGIIAIVAVMGFIMIGCEIDPEEALDEFPNPTVEAWEYGAYTGKPLTAVYKGKTQVTFAWYSTSSTTAIAGETNDTFTPTTAGTYYVQAIDKNKKFKNSTNVVVEAAPGYIDFLGKWKTSQQFYPAESPSGTLADEIIVITNDKFRLDSTYAGRTGGTGDTYTQGVHNYAAPFEYLDLNITAGWTELQNKTIENTTYDKAYSLNVVAATSTTKGYTVYSNFALYLKSATSGGGTVVTMRRTNAATATATIPRDYIQQ